jgi:hypothetical protein
MSITEQQAQPIPPHDAQYNEWRSALIQRDILHETVASKVLDDLTRIGACEHRPKAQDIEDAITMLCVSMARPPLEALLTVHEFLRNYAGIIEHQGGNE